MQVNPVTLLNGRITSSFFAREPVVGDSKEKALPCCARLRAFFIQTLMQVNLQRYE
jgi:hypothetical protein